MLAAIRAAIAAFAPADPVDTAVERILAGADAREVVLDLELVDDARREVYDRVAAARRPARPTTRRRKVVVRCL